MIKHNKIKSFQFIKLQTNSFSLGINKTQNSTKNKENSSISKKNKVISIIKSARQSSLDI